MFRLTTKRRENINRFLFTLIAVVLATMVFSGKGLIYFVGGCILVGVSVIGILILES